MTTQPKPCCMNCENIDVEEGDLFGCLVHTEILLTRFEAEQLSCLNGYKENKEINLEES